MDQERPYNGNYSSRAGSRANHRASETPTSPNDIMTPHRASTPESPYLAATPGGASSSSPFGDGIESRASHRSSAVGQNPFGTPAMSRPASSYESGSGIGNRFEERAQRYFHSRRVRKGEVEKPWLEKRHPKEKWVTILPIIGILVGLGISGVLVWDGIRSVVKHEYCMVLDENFSGGLRDDIWTKEVTVGGFGYVFKLSRKSNYKKRYGRLLTNILQQWRVPRDNGDRRKCLCRRRRPQDQGHSPRRDQDPTGHCYRPAQRRHLHV